MNKKEIGRYLAKLRKENGLTQKQIALRIGVEPYKIHNWENGILPSAVVLNELANAYRVTIDDVLECETQLSEKDLYSKYPGFTPVSSYAKDCVRNIYFNYQKDLLRAHARFKELIMTYRKNTLKRNENIEFEFLFKHMCSLSQLFADKYGKDVNNEYIEFLKILNKYKGCSPKEYYYEIRKYIEFFNTTSIQLPRPMYGDFEYDSLKGEQFKMLENWEKDMILACFQNDCYIWSSSKIGRELDDYEQRYGKEYNEEEVTKKAMKYCLEHGACINRLFLSFIITEKTEYNILSTLEDWYLDYKKPIFISYYSIDDLDCKDEKYAYVGQSDYTRFLRDYYDYCGISYGLDLSPKEVYEFLNYESEEKVVTEITKKLKIKDDKSKYSHLKARISIYLDGFEKDQKRLKQNRSDYKEYAESNDELKKKLLNGETKYYKYLKHDISEANGFNHYKLMNAWKSNVKYTDYLNCRDIEKTKELLSKIDSLSLDEIRKIYFPKKEFVYDD